MDDIYDAEHPASSTVVKKKKEFIKQPEIDLYTKTWFTVEKYPPIAKRTPSWSPGIEEKVPSKKLEQDTSQAPHVCASIVPYPRDHLSALIHEAKKSEDTRSSTITTTDDRLFSHVRHREHLPCSDQLHLCETCTTERGD